MTIGIRHDIKGYAYAEFEDSDGRRCNMAESTTDGYLWLGHENDGPRMHLDQEKLRTLLPLLQHFESEAELGYPPDHGDARVHEPAHMFTSAEPANDRIRLDMQITGQPREVWHLTQAQARGVMLVLAMAINGASTTAEASPPPADPRPFGDSVALIKLDAKANPEQYERLINAVEEWKSTTQPLVAGTDIGGPDRTTRALMVPCDVCDGTGTLTPDGGHGQNGTDICSRCGGEGRILASSGESPRAAFDPATGGYVGDREGRR